MAGFGGAVKLTGANEYKNALAQITQNLKVVSAEMKATASAFDVGDKSEKQLTQSAKELKTSLEAQKSALNTLKGQLSQMTAEYTKAGQKHQQLVSEYEKEKQKLDQIGKTLGTASTEYKNQQKTVANLEQEVQKSAKAYDAQGKAVNDMKIKTANAEATINQTAKELDNLGKEAKESGEDAKKGSDGFTVMKGVLSNLATQVITSAINGLKKLGQTFVDVGKQAISSYAEFEQLQGGVQKIFGMPELEKNALEDELLRSGKSASEVNEILKDLDSSTTVLNNAQQAFKTAGMSANQYMETVTSFSATLIAGLGGDTQKSAEIADKAIRDMADNANTFGTSIESIQNAYQGFAKGNYTMLDNLKLGYGGTKNEMLRLVKDAGVVEDSVKSLDDVSFDQMIEAIHIVQENLNITGTTAKEANGTIQGSAGSMKSAWQNLLTGMADENANFSKLTSDFIGTLITEDGKGGVIGNLVPRIATVITGMSTAISTALPKLVSSVLPVIQSNLPTILSAVSEIISTVITQAVILFGQVMPEFVSAGAQLIQSLIEGISTALPTMIEMLPTIITDVVTTLTEYLPEVVSEGIQIIVSLINGIMEAIPTLVEMLPTVIDTIVTVITENLPLIIETGLGLIQSLVDGILSAIPILIEKLPEVITAFLNTITEELPNIIQMGMDLLNSLTNGILKAIPMLVGMLPTVIETIVGFITDNLPLIIQTGIDLLNSLINGIVSSIPLLIDMLPTIIDTVVNVLLDNLPMIISTGFDLLIGIIDGILDAIPDLIEMLPKIIITITTTLLRNLPKILELGGKILLELIKGIGKVVWKVGEKIGEINDKMRDKFLEFVKKIPEIGQNIVSGIWNGISGAGGWLAQQVSSFASGILDSMKSALGIASPSKLFRDQVGKNLALGVGVGFENEMKDVTEQMQDSIPTSFETDATINGATQGSSAFYDMVSAFKEALYQVKIEMDDEEMGRFVDKTVTRLVYS
jgi:phage-related protein